MARPYTVKFGPWLPDLQNVGVEMGMQWTETELPVADCLNVYYADSSYRCLPGPSSIGPTLGTPILDAFTWYDNTGGKEIVFAATANGFSQLEDGVWTQIPLQVNASAGTVGLAISLALGTPFACAVWLTPSSQSLSNDTTSYTFPSVTANCGNGTPSAYSWSFSGATGPGTWSIASGAGTATAVPKVTGSTGGSTSTATMNCAITVSGNTYTCSSSVSYTQNTSILHTFTTSGTETVPAGYSNAVVEVWGGGGGGQGGNGVIGGEKGAGAGAGGYSRSSFSVTGGQTMTITVGAGGTGGASSFGVGTTGGTSKVVFGSSTLTANGGKPGNYTSGSQGGTASGGNQANTTGGAGSYDPGDGGTGDGGNATNGVHSNNPATYGDGGSGYYQTGRAGQSGYVSIYYT